MEYSLHYRINPKKSKVAAYYLWLFVSAVEHNLWYIRDVSDVWSLITTFADAQIEGPDVQETIDQKFQRLQMEVAQLNEEVKTSKVGISIWNISQ